MNRNIFGWSYPPGAENDPNAPWNQDEGPCAVCAKGVEDCICPECSICGGQGDPNCYEPKGEHWEGKQGHGLRLNKEQAISRQEAYIRQLENRLDEERMVVDMYKDGDQIEWDIHEVVDPWK